MSKGKKLTLYDLSEEMDSIFTMLITDEADEAAFHERFFALEIQLSEKMLSCRHVVKNWDGFIKSIEEEVSRLNEMKDRFKNARSSVLGRVKGILEKLDDGKYKDSQYGLGFRLQKNSGPKIEVHDLDALEADHPECVRITIERVESKTAIRELYKDKGVIPKGTAITEGRHVRVI